MGIKSFEFVDHGRNQAPVFDKHQQLSHTIGKPVSVEFHRLWKSRTQDKVLLEDILPKRTPKNIHCKIKKQKSIFHCKIREFRPKL